MTDVGSTPADVLADIAGVAFTEASDPAEALRSIRAKLDPGYVEHPTPRHYDVKSAYPFLAECDPLPERQGFVGGQVEKAAPLETLNEWMMTAKNDVVVVQRRISPLLQPEEAIRIAAWLIVCAELADFPRALEVAVATAQAIRNT